MCRVLKGRNWRWNHGLKVGGGGKLWRRGVGMGVSGGGGVNCEEGGGGGGGDDVCVGGLAEV